MLGKLIKYEFKASSGLFLLLYGALLLVSIINALLIYIGDGINEDNVILTAIQGFFMAGYTILIIAVAITTLVVIITRFYKNLMGDEGYLMFTLPVGTDSQIAGKLITSVVWTIISTIVVVSSIFIVTAKYNSFEIVQNFFNMLSKTGEINIPFWIFIILAACLIYTTTVILMFYAAMAIGPNLTKNRLLGSFLGFIILYVANQIIGLISLGIIYVTGFASQVETYGSDAPTDIRLMSVANNIGTYMIGYIIVLNLILAVIYYFVTRYFIKNKLNLA